MHMSLQNMICMSYTQLQLQILLIIQLAVFIDVQSLLETRVCGLQCLG